MTLLEQLKSGTLPQSVVQAAHSEGLEPESLAEQVAAGKAVITRNLHRPQIEPLAVGGGARIKVNANIGTSKDRADLQFELDKLRAALDAGADTVMDLSTGGDIDAVRREILAQCPVPLGTVPIYQAVIESIACGVGLADLDPDLLFEVIRRQCEGGVDFITVHCGINRNSLKVLLDNPRLMGIVSRGGSFLVEWMMHNKAENPLYERYDELLQIAAEHEVVLSLGDGFRPGSIVDATDPAQLAELFVLGELTKRARAAGVQVMVEGPGHVPLDQVQSNVELQKRICDGAPFYVLGPLVTDIAPGYDHIACAIGGALAAWHGADFLCYVTPSEHLGLPDVEQVRQGVIASKIAAHAADLARGRADSWALDRKMSERRVAQDWPGQIESAIDPKRAEELRANTPPTEDDVCTMCGEFCAIRVSKRALNKK
ncbi:MAG: phosphomethylpyrimidine synthase ThiC [Candidatus Alcyoniella australis]|nr:phosphomethylpyrimidine synthase ThiC [Candidatus Alcyoniella australis]